jgi:hypothetical protein
MLRVCAPSAFIKDNAYHSRIPYVGLVPEPCEDDEFELGNGDLPPQWGMDFVVYSGTMTYGPWADRQRRVSVAYIGSGIRADSISLPTVELRSIKRSYLLFFTIPRRRKG